MDYKKIRGAAMAYYANLSDEEQLKAWEFFKSIDTDGNGTISHREYRRSLEKIGYPIENTKNEFKMLDKNGDGVLDFEECITLFYLITVHDGTVYCDGCGIELWDIYFVCVGCYVAGGNTYDLCCDCYRKKNFEHPNAVFCDNLTLFKRMQPTATSASQVTTGEGQEGTYSNVKTSKGRVSKREIIKKAIAIGTLGVQATNAVTSISHSANVIAHSAAARNVVSAAANVDCPIM